MLGLRVRWIGLIGGRARTLIRKLVDALGVAVLRVKSQPIAELSTKPQVQRIVIRVDVAGRNIDREERRVGRLEEILIHQARQLMRNAALITDGGNEAPRQTMFDFGGVDVDVGVAIVGRTAVNLDRNVIAGVQAELPQMPPVTGSIPKANAGLAG